MNYIEFKEGDIVEYEGCKGRVFLLNHALEDILIEFDSKSRNFWNVKNPGILPKGAILHPDKYYYYPEISWVKLISLEENSYEIY